MTAELEVAVEAAAALLAAGAWVTITLTDAAGQGVVLRLARVPCGCFVASGEFACVFDAAEAAHPGWAAVRRHRPDPRRWHDGLYDVVLTPHTREELDR